MFSNYDLYASCANPLSVLDDELARLSGSGVNGMCSHPDIEYGSTEKNDVDIDVRSLMAIIK